MDNDREVMATSGGLGAPHGVTVVVAAFNAEASIEGAVASALKEPVVTELVLVDDASTDATLARARAIASHDPRVTIVARPVRGGPSRARNDGLAAATGSLVCFLDADDELLEGGLGALATELGAQRGAVVALGRFQPFGVGGASGEVGRWGNEQLQPVVRRHARMIESPDGMTPEALLTRLVSPPPGAWLVDTATARALGGFDARARRSEDLEFLVRLASAGRVVCADRDVLRYARHAAQRSARHARRRWGRAYTLWLALRAAPGAWATLALSRGMSAYHLEHFEARRRATRASIRLLGARNLVAAGLLRGLGVLAAVLPRQSLQPIAAVTGTGPRDLVD